MLYTTEKLIIDVLLWTTTHGHTSVGQPAKTFFHHFWADFGSSLDYLLGAIDNRDGWRDSQGALYHKHELKMMIFMNKECSILMIEHAYLDWDSVDIQATALSDCQFLT